MKILVGEGCCDENGVDIAVGTELSTQKIYARIRGGKQTIWNYVWTKGTEDGIKMIISTIAKKQSGGYSDIVAAVQKLDPTTYVQTDAEITRTGASTGKTGSHNGARIAALCSGVDGLSQLFIEPTSLTWATGTGTIYVEHVLDRSGE